MGTSLMGRASNARGMGLIPGRGTKIPHAVRLTQKQTKAVTINCFSVY